MPVSRPLRAFVVGIASWTALRIGVLWQVSTVIGFTLAEPSATRAIPFWRLIMPLSAITPSRRAAPVNLGVRRQRIEAGPPATAPPLIVTAGAMPAARTQAVLALSVMPQKVAAAPWLPSPARTGRLSGSAWSLFRPDGSGAALGTGGTLGGSQAGMRLYYAPVASILASTARLSAPLAMRKGREASVGVALRGRNVGLLIERRIALDSGARNAMSVTAYGEISDVVLPSGLRMEGYVQFGIVGARNRDGFADGAIRVAHPLIQSGHARLSLGGSVSGGFQPGTARLDIGPELSCDFPVRDKSMRITAGWRQRVAGGAAPGSGPSITIGFGF